MSTLTVTTINTANGTTDLTMRTGNSTGGAFVVYANGTGLIVQGNSSTNSMSVNTSAVVYNSNSVTFGTSLYFVANGNFGLGNSIPAVKMQLDGNYGIKTTSLSAGNNHNINCSSGNFFVVTANSSAQNVYFTSAPSGTAYGMIIRFANGNGGNTISWANTVRWPGGAAPTSSTNNDVWVFFTEDGGTTWRGSLNNRDNR